jgi:uncharacterized protein (TIGR03086 family)
MTDAVALHRVALDEFARRVDSIGPEDWRRPTPCTDWDVRALVRHLVYECLWSPPLFEGQTIADVGDRFEGDILGDDPKAAWKAAAAGADEAACAAGAMEQTVHLSFGDFPGEVYAMQIATDLTVHAWDLARGIGADEKLPDELVAACYEGVLPQVEMLKASGLFGAPVDVAADASTQDKLIALMGRDPARGTT